MVVMKFGGTSVADAPAIRRLIGIVQKQRALDEKRAGATGPAAQGLLVVVSALSGVTDRLLELGRMAGAGDEEEATRSLDDIYARHLDVATVVVDGSQHTRLIDEIEREFASLRGLIRALSVLREVSPRSLDAVVAVGEILSSRIVSAALADHGVPAVWRDARHLLMTDEEHTAASPLMEQTAARVGGDLRAQIADGLVPVVGGFIGATGQGVTTTLGRGGSDYSAAIFGACLGADEIQIWTDVDGMLTADPRIIDHPQVVPHLSFAEASELAYFGAKVLHPSTIQPAMLRDIPVRILNSRRPDGNGTVITASPPPRVAPLTAIACKRNVTVIDITSTRMLMSYGFLRRVFEVFERFRTPVDVITTSEVSLSVTIDDCGRLGSLLEALSAFAEVSSEHDMALMCAVGENMRADPTLFAGVLGALDGVALRMVSQAGSRRNITFVLRQADLSKALTRLHGRFFSEAVAGRAEV